MTVAATTRSNTYVGDGITDSFPVTFQFFEIDVYLNGVIVTAGVDYTVTQLAPGGTGDVVFNTPPDASIPIAIVGNTSASQSTDFVDNDALPAEVLERALDRLAMGVQESKDVDGTGVRRHSYQGPMPSLDFLGNPDTLVTVDENGDPELRTLDSLLGDITPTVVAARDAALAAQAASEDAQVAAEIAQSGAETAYSETQKAILAPNSADPAFDDEGNALNPGVIYWNTSLERWRLFNGDEWVDYDGSQHSIADFNFTASQGQTVFTGLDDEGKTLQYRPGLSLVLRNGVKLVQDDDYFATDSGTVTLAIGANEGNVITVVSFSSFNVADTYTQEQVDAKVNQRGLPAGGSPGDRLTKVSGANYDAVWAPTAEAPLAAVRAVALSDSLNIATDLEAGDSVDGVFLVAGNYILLARPTTDTHLNGIYVVQAAGAPTRLTGFDVLSRFVGLQVNVTEGSEYTGQTFRCRATGVGVIDTDPLLFDFVRPGTRTFPVIDTSVGNDTHEQVGIPSWARKIFIAFNAISVSGNGSNTFVRIGTALGLDSSTYEGASSEVAGSSAGSSSNGGGFRMRASDNGNFFSGLLSIARLGDTDTWVADGTLYASNSARSVFFGGRKTLSATLDRVGIVTSSTFDAGSIQVSYE